MTTTIISLKPINQSNYATTIRTDDSLPAAATWLHVKLIWFMVKIPLILVFPGFFHVR